MRQPTEFFLENSAHFQREGDLAQNGEVCTIDAFSTDLGKASIVCCIAQPQA